MTSAPAGLSPRMISWCRSLLADLDRLTGRVASAIRAQESYYANHMPLADLVRVNRAKVSPAGKLCASATVTAGSRIQLD